MRGEISTVLYKEQIKYLRSHSVWPSKFDNEPPTDALKSLEIKDTDKDSAESSDEDDDLFQNTNRLVDVLLSN